MANTEGSQPSACSRELLSTDTVLPKLQLDFSDMEREVAAAGVVSCSDVHEAFSNVPAVINIPISLTNFNI